MSERHGWMPVWLATYLFIVGLIGMSWFTGMFAFLMSESGLPYMWYYRYTTVAIGAIPWLWYFTYLGTRYFDRIPLPYYLWIIAPFYGVLLSTLKSKTVFDHIFVFADSAYFIRISGVDAAMSLIIAFVVLYLVGKHVEVDT